MADTILTVTFNFPSSQGSAPSDDKRRQIFYLGAGFYVAIVFINLVLLLDFEFTKPRVDVLCILAPSITVVFTIVDTFYLRMMVRRLCPSSPEMLSKWPVSIKGYPTWIYSLCLVVSVVISGYLASRF